jgi:hypothetical protein
MIGIPKFSDVQKVLKRIFSQKEGCIYIFTEDKKDDQIFYDLLLSRLCDESLKIESITPLGSRSNVMKRSLEDNNPQVPTLYIIDGDIDLLIKQPIESSNLIGLDRYCIENYLCCENGLISLLVTNYGNSNAHYKSKLDFQKTLTKFCYDFQKIAVRYYVAQQLECQTGFKKADDFFFIRSKGVFKLDKPKVNAEIQRIENLIKNKIKENKIKAYKSEMIRLIKDVEKNNPFDTNNYLKVISGKDFLLPILEKKIKLVEGRLTNWSTDQFKRNLAERIDVSSLHRVKLKMQKLAVQ